MATEQAPPGRGRQLDVRGKNTRYVIEVAPGRFAHVSSTTNALVQWRAEGRTPREIASLMEQAGHSIHERDVDRAYNELDAKLAALLERRISPSFFFRLPILPASAVQWLAGKLQWGFRVGFAIPAILVSLTVVTEVLARAPRLTGSHDDLLLAYGFFAVSMLLHELGHAAACLRYGARPSEIGFAFYLVFPSFYSNVTSAWELPRRQRVIVDLAGIYFQLVCACLSAGTSWLTGATPFLIVTWWNLATCVLSLNPLLKLDGYWALADVLGIPDLHAESRRMLFSLLKRGRRESPEVVDYPQPLLLLLVGYNLASGIFLAWMLAVLGPVLLDELSAYPQSARDAFSLNHASAASVLAFVLKTGVLMAMIVIGYRLLAAAARGVTAAARTLQGDRYAR
jgi:putative peptide zinc metalloprotease protein